MNAAEDNLTFSETLTAMLMKPFYIVSQDQTHPLTGDDHPIPSLADDKVARERKPRFVRLQAVKAPIRHPDALALKVAMDGLRDAFDLQILTAYGRVFYTVDVQGQGHHAFVG